jgi:hypothetical protein
LKAARRMLWRSGPANRLMFKVSDFAATDIALARD